VIVPEFQVHPGNGALVTAISFLDTRRNRKGPLQASKGVGSHNRVFNDQKWLCWQSCVHWHSVKVYQPAWLCHWSRHFWWAFCLGHCKTSR